MADVATRIRLSADDQATASLRRVGLELEGLKRRVEGLSSVPGNALGMVGVAGAGLGIQQTITAFAAYEQSVLDMGKVTEQNLGLVRRQIEGLPPILGSSAELMQGYYQTMSAGVTEPKAALDLMTVGAKMAKVAHVQQAEAILALTKSLSGYRGELTSAAQAADWLFAVEKIGQTTVRELIPEVGDLATTANQLAIRSHELGGALALVSQTAGSTAQAATQVKSLMMGLYKPTEDMAKVIRGLGYASTEALLSDRGLVGALKAVQAKGATLKIPVSKMFEDREALIAFSAISTSGFATLRKYIDDVAASTGGLATSWERWTVSFTASTDRLKANLGNLGNEIGERLAERLKPKLTELNDWIENKHTRISEGITSFGYAVGELTQGISGLFSEIMTGWGRLPTVIQEMGLIAALIGGHKARGAIVMLGLASNGIKGFYDTVRAEDAVAAGTATLEQQITVQQSYIDRMALSGESGLDEAIAQSEAKIARLRRQLADEIAARKDVKRRLHEQEETTQSPALAAPKSATPSSQRTPTGAGTLPVNEKALTALREINIELAKLTMTEADAKLAELQEKTKAWSRDIGGVPPQLKRLLEVQTQLTKGGVTDATQALSMLRQAETEFDKLMLGETGAAIKEANEEYQRRLTIVSAIGKEYTALATKKGRTPVTADDLATLRDRRTRDELNKAIDPRQYDMDQLTLRRDALLRLEGLSADQRVKINQWAANEMERATIKAYDADEQALREFNREYLSIMGSEVEARRAAIEEQSRLYRAAKVGDAEHARRVAEWQKEQELRISRDAHDGMTRGLKDISQEYTNAAKHWEDITRTAFDGMSDAITDWAMGADANINKVGQSLLRMFIKAQVQENIMGPLAKAMGGFSFGKLFGIASAQGNVFAAGPGISAYSNTVVDHPTLFPFARGIGLMGEAGAEAIMPLVRTSSGNLGVRAEGSATPQNIRVELTNESGHQLQATQANARFDLDTLVLGIVINGYQNDTLGMRRILAGGA